MQIKKLIRKIRELYRIYPLPGSIAAVSLAFSLSKLCSLMLKMFPESILKDYLIQGGVILSAWLIVLLLGYQWCYRRGSTGKTILAGLPLILLAGYNLANILFIAVSSPEMKWLPAAGIVLGILKLFAIGFLEESLFRGVAANSFGIRCSKDAGGVWLAVVLSGLLFGVFHFINISAGVSLRSVLVQTVTACIFGLYFAAIYFRGGNIWVMIFIHALFDSPGLFRTLFTVTETTQIDAINESSFEGWYFYPVFLILTVFLLRREKMTEITANLCSCAKEDESSNSYIDKVHRS